MDIPAVCSKHADTDTDIITSISDQVITRIKPGEGEKKRLQVMAGKLISDINNIARAKGIEASGILVGSAARDTWISGEHDLDIFIMFPEDADRDYLEEKGLEMARDVAANADAVEERYAEHPYIHAVFGGFEVDIVPCFKVQSAASIKSAVDRTPFHSEYIKNKIKGREDEVLLLKQFMKGCGVYGSELKTQGFSGYLTELLIIHYGSFLNCLKGAVDWKPGMVIDLEGHGTVTHADPFVVVDPTDPARNVAAALSLDRFCEFIDAAREFLETPSSGFFFPPPVEPMNDEDLKNVIHLRGTSLFAIGFDAPDVVEDVLFPQLFKMEQSLRELISKKDFRIFKTSVWSGKTSIILAELEVASLPAVKRHTGPAVWMKDHARKFKKKYEGSGFSKVYIENGKYMADVKRKYTHARALIEKELTSCAMGKHVSRSVKKGFRVLQGEEILAIMDVEFRRFLRGFFEGGRS